MSTINIVKTIKLIHKYDIVLIKSGKFYHAYGKDSYIISFLFKYQIRKIEDTTTCGFPLNSLNKVIAKLEENKINYIILDRRNSYDIEQKSDNKNLNNYEKIYEKAKIWINYKVRIDNINNFMMENIDKKDFKKILQKMEEVINERREVSSY